MKPATELPWSITRNSDAAHIHADKNQEKYVAACLHIDGGDKDAAYIVHACNAYPKLVEALKECADAVARSNGSKSASVDAFHLLRELGEET